MLRVPVTQERHKYSPWFDVRQTTIYITGSIIQAGYVRRPFWPHETQKTIERNKKSKRGKATSFATGRWQCLPNPSLEEQVGVTLQADASLEEALKGIALPVETVDDFSAWKSSSQA